MNFRTLFKRLDPFATEAREFLETINLSKRNRFLFLAAITSRNPKARIAASKPLKGEPHWSLFSEDPLASGVVREWCSRAATAGVNQEKITGALMIAERMDRMEPGLAFTLRGRDPLAPGCISLWIGRARSRGAAHGLITSAEAARESFTAYSPKKLPD